VVISQSGMSDDILSLLNSHSAELILADSAE
jgi:hypothetical protein